jgi:hypothetical protein
VQLLRQKFSIAPDQLTVEIDLAATVFWALDAYHVPVDLAPIPIIRFFVSLARSKMKRAGDFLVE